MALSRLAISALLMLTAAPSEARELSQDDHVTLARFEQALAAQPSATKVLQEWCAAQGFVEPARILAQHLTGEDAPPPIDLRRTLNLTDADEVGYRHVQLTCGPAQMSEAHNWYVRSRLTPQMNAMLNGTDTPFGTVAAGLHFTREALESHHGAGPGCPPDTVLTHRALLRLPDGRPLALLVECYLSDILRGPGKLANPPSPR